mmetsp:Transcript_464/g.959  ORF Transcript_464/g.959 Transcript_464/m.959 type:complete len:217 (+) Transcript_464:1148-1798(+)
MDALLGSDSRTETSSRPAKPSSRTRRPSTPSSSCPRRRTNRRSSPSGETTSEPFPDTVPSRTCFWVSTPRASICQTSTIRPSSLFRIGLGRCRTPRTFAPSSSPLSSTSPSVPKASTSSTSTLPEENHTNHGKSLNRDPPNTKSIRKSASRCYLGLSSDASPTSVTVSNSPSSEAPWPTRPFCEEIEVPTVWRGPPVRRLRRPDSSERSYPSPSPT